jgi:hypothetical protein
MEQKFRQQGLRLDLVEIIPMNQPGRSGKPRARSRRIKGRKDTSGNYGGMVICRFEGPNAVENRYALGDDYTGAGLDVPDFNQERHPNDYRPDPNSVEPPEDPTNPNRRTIPDPDPNRPDPYDQLPF